VLLQRRDLARDHRTGHAKLVGDRGEAAEVRHPHEEVHRIEPVHCCSPSNFDFSIVAYFATPPAPKVQSSQLHGPRSGPIVKGRPSMSTSGSTPMNTRYTATAKTLHWLIAVLIFGMLGLGFYMTGLDLSPTKLQIYSWHKWAGVTIAAHAGHHLLYVLMFAIPLTGWLMSSAKGFQTVWFGVLPIPDLLAKDKALGDLLQTVHVVLNLVLIAVLLGHVGAALKHHFFDKDDVLTRMLPGRAD